MSRNPRTHAKITRDELSRMCVELTHAAAWMHDVAIQGQPGAFALRHEQVSVRLADAKRKFGQYVEAIEAVNAQVIDAAQEKEQRDTDE